MFGADDDLPCADFGLLDLLKHSPEYRAMRRRGAAPKPVDAWQSNSLHYFVFKLRPTQRAAEGRSPYSQCVGRTMGPSPLSSSHRIRARTEWRSSTCASPKPSSTFHSQASRDVHCAVRGGQNIISLALPGRKQSLRASDRANVSP